MMARRGVIGLLTAAAGVLALGGCGLFGGTHSFRYRITVEVETPEGLKTGFAVREINYTRQWIKLPDMAEVVATQRGEAVAIDLPGGQTLFALLSTNGYETLQAAFGNDAPETLDKAKANGQMVDLKPKPGSIPEQSGYPMLVRFTDLQDPKSVELVDPSDLAASFGSDLRLKRITMQIVDEPVTEGINRRLEWLGNYPEPRLDSDYRGSSEPSLSQRLSHGNFVRGEAK